MQKKGMELEGLVKSGDVVLAGVSGGADSVCLLLMLLEYRKHCDFLLEAVHVEHGIRGDASRRDAAFVKKLCEERGVCCRIYPLDVPAYAREHGLGVEEAARKLRYECFKEAAEDYGGRPVKIALAHHADDNAETMLFRLDPGERNSRTLRYAPGAQARGGRHGDPAAAWNGESGDRGVS